jgi:signal transduction histidine kinase
MGDAGRLETQLENSLFLADTESSGLLIESVDIKNLVDAISHHWPKMAIEVSGTNQRVLGDRRALESVVRNLAQNASRHGQATKLSVEIQKKSDFVEVNFRDNGIGFKGDHKRLGIIFDRQTGTSGSGIGLYLVTKLVERMQGEVRFKKPVNDDTAQGFEVTLRFLSADANAERRD